MISTTRNYGKFVINGYTDELEISIQRTGDETSQELVKQAIMFANENKCRISRQVEYTPNEGVTFKVKCDGNTSRFIYEYGKFTRGRSVATDKDIKAYKSNFGTDGCIHKGFVKKYWYTEPFHGDIKYFDTLDDAKESAANELGNAVTIYTNIEMHNYSTIVCFAEASGIYLP